MGMSVVTYCPLASDDSSTLYTVIMADRECFSFTSWLSIKVFFLIIF